MSVSLTSLISSERSERIAHDRSFPLSNLSDLLRVAHLSWAIWANRSQSLICFEQNERLSEGAIERRSDWANERLVNVRIPSPDFQKHSVKNKVLTNYAEEIQANCGLSLKIIHRPRKSRETMQLFHNSWNSWHFIFLFKSFLFIKRCSFLTRERQ